jgi:4-carboxymuconolactone decarboxylase
MKSTTPWGLIALAMAGGWLAGNASGAPARPPRFPQLTMAQLNDEQRPIGERIMSFSRVGLGGPYHIMLRSPAGAQKMLDLLDYLRFHTSVPTRLNEFAILIQGRLWRSQVEWYGHYPTALKAGVAAETLADLKAGRRPTSMKDDEAAVYDFCMELYTGHQVSDATYARLHQFLNDQQIVDLTSVSGTYVGIAALLAMAEQGPPPGEDLPFKPGDP